MDDPILVIPSRGRADVELQTTLRFLSEAGLPVTMIVPSSQLGDYAKLTSVYPLLYIFGRPESVTNLSQSLDWIIHEWAPSGSKLILFDDDLRFSRRIDQTGPKLRMTGPEDIKDLVTLMHELLKVDPMVGVSARGGNNVRFPANIEYCCRQMQVHGVDVDFFREEWIKPSAVTCKSDFHMTLSVLQAGRRNAVICNFAVDQYRGSNAAGGVSEYRNADVMDQAALRLYELHSKFVTVVRKKVVWRGLVTNPLDVRVAWKQAYQEGIS